MDWYKDGLFTGPGTKAWKTKWPRGSNQTVVWKQTAYHQGGYAYRLCKVKGTKYWEANEECFQKGHLKFAGKYSW